MSKIKLKSCIKCGSEAIELYDCGYSSFNCGGGKCKDCGHDAHVCTLGCFPSKKELARAWNAGNTLSEVDTLRNAVYSLKARIEELERLLNKGGTEE